MTDQLLCIAKATDSQIYTKDLDAEAHGCVEDSGIVAETIQHPPLPFYEKGMTRAMIDLQEMHSSNTFRCSNVSSSVGLKIILPLVF